MKDVCWGMVGCGAVTEVKSGPPLYKAQNSRLKAVFDLDHAHACDWAKRHGVPVVYETVEELLADEEITAVYLPTPPQFHKQYALQCLAAGKIPYIEKPMASTYEDCLEILEASDKAGIPVYVAYYRRGMEKYLKIKEILDSGVLGGIRLVRLCQYMKPEPADLDKENLPWRLQPAAGGGKFVDMVTHVLDVVEYFFGEIAEVHGTAQNLGGLYRVEDTLAATMQTKSGVLVSGSWCYVTDHDAEEMLILGEKGHITTTGLFNGPLKVVANGEETLYEFADPQHVAGPYIQLLVNEMAGGTPAPADAKSAANNVRVVDEILKEYRKQY